MSKRIVKAITPIIPFILGLSTPVLAAGETTQATVAKNDASTEKATTTLTFTNKMVNGKKTWLPASATVPAGSQVKITLVNTLDEPHGFEVMGLSKAIVVNAKKSSHVSFKAEKKGEFNYRCQMHPTHVGGKIVIK